LAKEIEADKICVKNLFAEPYWFRIPYYQRSYLWQNDNVRDLLDDLWFAFENDPEREYFMGALVLDKEDEYLSDGEKYTVYDIIDGQQRLTTFMIVMSVLRDLFYQNQDMDGVEILKRALYQKESFFTSTPNRMRLTYKIRDIVEDFMMTYLIETNGTNKVNESVVSQSNNISASNMASNLIVIRDFVTEKGYDPHFLKYLLNKVVYIYVATDERSDAFRLFSIVNNRGIPLTNADILKATNIGEFTNEKDLNKYASIWEQIENNMGVDGFERFLNFLQSILVKDKARGSLLDEFEKNIYKKGLLQKGEQTLKLIQDYSSIYYKVVTFDDFEPGNDYKNLVTIMDIGLPSEEWIPPLLYFYKRYNSLPNINALMTKFLGQLEAKFSSDWISGYSLTDRVNNMNSILKAIEFTAKPEDLFSNNDLFQINTDFLKSIFDQDVYGRKFARYILLKYEYLKMSDTVHLSGFSNLSVEHVLPQNPSEESQWNRDFTEEERKTLTHKLGNLTLINMRKNSVLSNLDFKEKKKRYLEKRLEVFPGCKLFIEQQEEWTPEIIQKRHEEMVYVLMASFNLVAKK